MALRDRSAPKPRRPGERMQRSVARISFVLLLAFLALSMVFAYAVSTGSQQPTQAAVSVTALLIFLVSVSIGSLVGFVFGLPRSRLADQASAQSSTAYLTNSNLIKVSDWVTTIVVGLALVNLGRLVPTMADLGSALEQPLGDGPQAGTVGVCAVVTGLVSGALLTYLWTTLQYRALLEENEKSVETPDLTQGTLEEAKKVAGSHGLRIQTISGAGQDADRILHQRPLPHEPVTAGSIITVSTHS